MALILDTHCLIWIFVGDARMTELRLHMLAETDVIFVSAASAFEIVTKHRIGKLPDAAELVHDFQSLIARFSYTPLPISIAHAHLAASLPSLHKDPFDRLLAAQAMIEDVPIMSVDAQLQGLGARIVW